MQPIRLVVCLIALFTPGLAFAASPVAYVYVQQPLQVDSTTAPIYAYSATSSGALTPIKGSPFTANGALIGTNGTHFITSYQTFLYSLDVASDGAIVGQATVINTGVYTGSECGSISGGVLDHTGQDVYVTLNLPGTCADVQTFEIGKTGTLTFLGATGDISHGAIPAETPLKILGNNKLAFNAPEAQNWTSPASGCNPYMNGFSRASNGTLDYTVPTVSVTGPTPESGEDLLPVPWLITDDPTDHLALAVFNTAGAPCGNGGPVQLASFTANSEGALTSTNTAENMPTVPGGATSMILNPAGTILAVATGTGVQFFHFNGAEPITEFTGIIGTSGFISAMAWDNSNHLYALNGASGRLHVYDATTTSVKEVSGSPYNNVCGTDTCTLIVRYP
jgi:hypothetical protein